MSTPKPLSGIRVLDMSRVLAGPLAGQILADMGAEVIKVERPVVGDDARSYGPPYLADADGNPTRDNAFYICANRGKRSIEADISTQQGRDVLIALAGKSDVLIENYRVDSLRRYGLDHATMIERFPRLVYCSISGYGQTGPYRHLPGYDAVFQGMSGLMSVTGNPDGTPGDGPVKVGPSMADILTGLYAGNAVLGALMERERSGKGQHIDLALLDSTVAAMSHLAQMYLISGHIAPRRGTEGNGGVPSRMFNCADGGIMLTAGNDRQFVSLCEVLGCPELASDPRYVDNLGRMERREELNALLNARFATRPAAYWLERLEAAEVPAGPVYDLAQVFADPQIRQRGMAAQVDHPVAGPLRLVGNPIHYSRTPLGDFAAPPTVGQHTAEVLSSLLGYDDSEVARYIAAQKVEKVP